MSNENIRKCLHCDKALSEKTKTGQNTRSNKIFCNATCRGVHGRNRRAK